MDFIAYLVFLILLSGLTLFIIGLIFLIDLANVHIEQKLKLTKMGLLLIGISPIIFAVLRIGSWQTLTIKLSGDLINESLVRAIPLASNETPFPWRFFIFVIYLVGFITMIFRILCSYVCAKNQLSKSLPGIIQGQTIYLNKSLQTPLSFGFPKAKIYFPSESEKKWTPREIEMSLTHEKIHLQQNDSFWKFLSLVIRALLFFVPWAYYLHRRFELELEIFCDKKTCLETNADISEYGNLLLRMVSAVPTNPVFNNLTSPMLKRRFLAMKTKTVKRSYLITIISIFFLLTTGTVIAMASGITEKNSIYEITSKVSIDGKLISSPRIIARANQFASIFISDKKGTNSLRLEVITKNASIWGANDDILMNFDVQYKNGREQVHSKPEFVLAPDQEGIIKMTSNSGHLFEMRVVAKRY